MIITKLISQTKDGYRISVRDGKKSLVLHGNIPKVYGGMLMNFETDGTKIVSYQYIFCKRNNDILAKHLDEIESLEKFFSKVSFHQELQTILWKDLNKTYGRLPFDKADRIALHKGKKPTDKERISCIHNEILNIMRNNANSFVDLGKYIDFFRSIEEKGSFPRLALSEVMEVLSSEYIFGINKNGLYDKELVKAEEYIRSSMAERMTNSEILVSDSTINAFLTENHFLSEDQKQTVRCINSRHPDFITGGAGTGKTTVIKAIVDCYGKEFGLNALCLLAPTGRASERMTEVIGIQARTIHSALRKTPDSEYVYYNENNPLPYALIIVDESSMVDSLLMADLLKATQTKTKLIFVGDCNQLPPVSCGKPFYDFLASGSFYRLMNNHRQGEHNLVLTNAYHILDEEPLESGENFVIKEISEKDITKYCSRDIQCLTPYNATNDIINQHLRNDKTGNYAVGDKVIALVNTKDYFNGDIFEITSIENKNYVLSKQNKKESITVTNLDDFALAYAITIHKMQGSECDEIKLFLPKESKFVTRNMLYTAVTRAKHKVELYYYS